jgi:4-amino-4-deoxy-L-arabinose transferase-like glycosyltransferase
MFSSASFRRYELLIVLIASALFLSCIISPPSLMDDVDSVQASIARSMLQTGDWVTPRLDGVKYFEKPPLKYWLIAIFFKIFGVHDYIARLPLAVTAVLLCWLTFRIGAWAFGARAGFYSGLVLSTCVGFFLFTRVLIVDAQLTFAIAIAIWSFLRALDYGERHPRRWALGFWAACGVAVLFKGLIGVVFPVGAAIVYLALTKQILTRETLRRLVPLSGLLVFLAIAAPWHIMATLRNPPYFYFGLHSGPGHYHGFLWFYFINEHLLRFLNRRYPEDYSTVPRLYFWLLHLVWLFPWSVYFPALFRLEYRRLDRPSRTRLMALCWTAVVMVFFTFSSTQEYYSLPAYPALALLLGCAMASPDPAVLGWLRRGNPALVIVSAISSAAILFILLRVWRLPTHGDISQALAPKERSTYTLSLDHFGDLTLNAFAYLRGPLLLAFTAFLIGLVALFAWKGGRRFVGIATMMVIFFQAARLAMVTFDPYLSSRPLARSLRDSPPGCLIADDQYYTFSSVFFYANTAGLLHNGRVNNLEYGSNAQDASHMFIDDADLARMWQNADRCYLLVDKLALNRIERVIGPNRFTVVKESGGKLLLTNIPLAYLARSK